MAAPAERLLALVVFGAVAIQRVVAQTREECIAAAAAINFEVLAFDRYDEFFNNASVMQQAEAPRTKAGKYTGPDAIREYVSLAVAERNPFLLDGNGVRRRDENPAVLLFKPSKDGLCELLYIFDVAYGYAEMSGSAGYALQAVAMFRIFINPQAKIITRINVHYAEGTVRVQLGTLLWTPEVHEHMCTTMRDSCADVWRANGLDGVEQCIQTLQALPRLDEPGDHADGNSSGCRFIHSVLAVDNTFHCPHISFIPIADDNGSIKCQVSIRVTASDLFEPTDLEAWQATAERFGVPAGFAAWGPPCDDDADCKSGFTCTTPDALDAGRRLLFSAQPSNICVYPSTRRP